MGLMTWIGMGIVTVLGFIVLVPLLVVGGWFVIINVILGLVNGAAWLLDEGWRTVRGGKKRHQTAGGPSPTLRLALERK